MWIAHGTCLFFFFKQKTAYEMRISDWMSDVCSSDLGQHALDGRLALRDDLVRTVELEQPDGPESRRDVNVGRLAGEPRPRDAVLDDAQRGDHHAEHRGMSRLAPEDALGEGADGRPLGVALLLLQLAQQVADRKSPLLNSSH